MQNDAMTAAGLSKDQIAFLSAGINNGLLESRSKAMTLTVGLLAWLA